MMRRSGKSCGVEETRSAVVREEGEGGFAGVLEGVINHLTSKRTMRCCTIVAAALKLRKKRYWKRMGDVDSHRAWIVETLLAKGPCFSIRAQVRYTSKRMRRVPRRR